MADCLLSWLESKRRLDVYDVQSLTLQTTQQQVRQTVEAQQTSVREIFRLAPIPDGETDCRYCWLAAAWNIFSLLCIHHEVDAEKLVVDLCLS